MFYVCHMHTQCPEPVPGAPHVLMGFLLLLFPRTAPSSTQGPNHSGAISRSSFVPAHALLYLVFQVVINALLFAEQLLLDEALVITSLT